MLQQGQYNEKADIFSFAMVMYNLFHRVIPSVLIMSDGDEGDMAVYAWNVANGFRPQLSEKTVPRAVSDLINKCWSGVPELRPSAAEVVATLQGIQASGVCSALPVLGKDTASAGCSCSLM